MDDPTLPDDPQELFDLIAAARAGQDWKRAQELGRAMLRAVVARYGAYHGKTDQALALMSRVHRDAGDILGATFFSEAMKRPRELGGMNPVPVGPEEEAQVAAKVAQAGQLDERIHGLLQERRYAEAEPLAVEMLELNEWIYGGLHPTVATSVGKLAGIRRMLIGNTVALPLYERSLRIRETTLGPDFPDVAMSLAGLAAVLDGLDQVPRCIQVLERYVKLTTKDGKPDPEAVAWLHDVRQRPVTAEAASAMSREELFVLVAEEVFRDGVVEAHENEILNRLVHFLKLSPDRAKEICRAAKERFEAGVFGKPRPLDRGALYERILASANADGKVDPEEARMLEGMRRLLGRGAG